MFVSVLCSCPQPMRARIVLASPVVMDSSCCTVRLCFSSVLSCAWWEQVRDQLSRGHAFFAGTATTLHLLHSNIAIENVRVCVTNIAMENLRVLCMYVLCILAVCAISKLCCSIRKLLSCLPILKLCNFAEPQTKMPESCLSPRGTRCTMKESSL